MTATALMLALQLRPNVARIVWCCLLTAGIVNAFVLNTQSYNLVHSNLIHYYLGAKYAVPYKSFYECINAALDKPQIGMRDLRRPDRFVRRAPSEQRAYYIDLIREDGTEFDGLDSLPELHTARARHGGTAARIPANSE